MSAIDEVIERSRQPGAFTARQKFSVARSNAIRKMRQFALADPHYFALELIQSAVANGAEYVDIASEKTFFALSYIGGGYVEEELAQLFDFLFASKSDLEHSDLRQLALGLNALMLMKPAEIVVESGDGTLEGTSRIVIRGEADMVEVGQPAQPLRGTFISAQGLQRKLVKKKSTLIKLPIGERECTAIEERCLTAPVPVLVNSEPLFGYSTARTPSLFGYDRAVSFDEGDLYGTIGLSSTGGQHVSFRLLTYGVWVQSMERSLIPNTSIGGVVCFDALNKTADHAAIVRDSRLEEMWVRLLPYARQLMTRRAGQHAFSFTTTGGEPLSLHAVRALLREHPRVVVIASDTTEDRSRKQRNAATQRGVRIGALLNAPVLCSSRDDVQSLRHLAGRRTQLIVPALETDEDLSFYQQPVVEEPRRPWLIGAIDLDPLPIAELATWMLTPAAAQSRAVVETFATALGGELLTALSSHALVGDERVEDAERFVFHFDGSAHGEEQGKRATIQGLVEARLYSPAHEVSGCDAIQARVVSTDRLLWAGEVPCAFPGHVLELRLDGVMPRALESLAPEALQQQVELPEALATTVVHHALEHFQTATRRALESVDYEAIAPGSGAAKMLLAYIARESMLRLRQDPAHRQPRLELFVLEHTLVDLCALPLLETRTGRPVSLREVVGMLHEHHGLVYGTLDEVPADLRGLDEDRILRLTPDTERLLITILGESSYVRVDGRDVLYANESGDAQLRDIALGLHDYADAGALLWEGPAPARWSGQERAAQEMRALTALVELWHGSACQGVSADAENRRQASRHLQRFIVYRCVHEPRQPTHGIDRLPLFVDSDGAPCAFIQLQHTAAQTRGIIMSDGRGLDVTGMDVLHQRALDDALDDDAPVAGLSMSPFVFELLAPLVQLHSAFDFAFDRGEQAGESPGESDYLESIAVDIAGFEGRLGIPLLPPQRPSVAFITRGHQHVHALQHVAQRYGVIGHVRQLPGEEGEPSQARLSHAALRVLHQTFRRLGALHDDPARWLIAITALLDFAARHMQLTATPQHTIAHNVMDPLAQQVLDLPLFDTTVGVPVSAQRLIDDLCSRVDLTHGAHRPPAIQLAGHVPPPLAAWVARHVRPEVIVRPSSRPRTARVEAQGAQTALEPDDRASLPALAHFSTWLRALRPDHIGLDRIRIHHRDADDAFTYISERLPGDVRSTTILELNPTHWLIAWALDHLLHDPEALAWLLLGSYAHINEVLETVTNAHELAFQRAVASALERGVLNGPPEDDPERGVTRERLA